MILLKIICINLIIYIAVVIFFLIFCFIPLLLRKTTFKVFYLLKLLNLWIILFESEVGGIVLVEFRPSARVVLLFDSNGRWLLLLVHLLWAFIFLFPWLNTESNDILLNDNFRRSQLLLALNDENVIRAHLISLEFIRQHFFFASCKITPIYRRHLTSFPLSWIKIWLFPRTSLELWRHLMHLHPLLMAKWVFQSHIIFWFLIVQSNIITEHRVIHVVILLHHVKIMMVRIKIVDFIYYNWLRNL